MLLQFQRLIQQSGDLFLSYCERVNFKNEREGSFSSPLVDRSVCVVLGCVGLCWVAFGSTVCFLLDDGCIRLRERGK